MDFERGGRPAAKRSADPEHLPQPGKRTLTQDLAGTATTSAVSEGSGAASTPAGASSEPSPMISSAPRVTLQMLFGDRRRAPERAQDPAAAAAGRAAVSPRSSRGDVGIWARSLTLGGDVATWRDQIKSFLASQFGASINELEMATIADGRSGDKVYKVTVTPAQGEPYKGIFKVFNDPDTADAEIDIGNRMRDLGMTTPKNRGVTRVDTDEGPPKVGALFDFAPGVTPTSLVKRIGGLDKSDPGRPALYLQLKAAVAGVARQLAKLHHKAGRVGRIQGPESFADSEWMDNANKLIQEKGRYQIHIGKAVQNGKLTPEEASAITAAFDALLQDNLVDQNLRRSMAHGDANAANFLVDGEAATVIDVETARSSLGPSGPISNGAVDTGRFLETLRTSWYGALTSPELAELDVVFHAAYMPGSADQHLPDLAPGEQQRLGEIDKEKAADEKAEIYYRACWILNRIKYAREVRSLRWAKLRLVELIPALAGKIAIPEDRTAS